MGGWEGGLGVVGRRGGRIRGVGWREEGIIGGRREEKRRRKGSVGGPSSR